MKLEILEEAENELNEAVAYYQEIESGLGIRLKEEVCGAIQAWRCAPGSRRKPTLA